MSKFGMEDYQFEELLERIYQQTDKTEKKLDILFTSRGFFTALQASKILYAFAIPSDKVKAIEVMEPRLCRMTCSEARDVLGSLNIQNDKIRALNCIKRVLCDSQTQEGAAAILSAFPFEADKRAAMSILGTVVSFVSNKIPAGGHQGYAALGGLYTQSRPLVPHLYGSVEEQKLNGPGSGSITLPAEAHQVTERSLYTSHPSYAPMQGRNYAEDRGFPGNTMYDTGTNQSSGTCTNKPPLQNVYPAGAPPLGLHQGGPAPTGYQSLTMY